jgi:hypothetical protein
MMLAQGLGEYGAVGGGAVGGGDGGAFSSLASALAAIEGAVRDAEPRTWIIASVTAASSGSCSCGHDRRRGSCAVSEVTAPANS